MYRNNIFYKTLDIKETSETNENLLKTVKGSLKLKYKVGYYTRDFSDLSEDERLEINPDFGFISDFYVPQYILSKYSININCDVTARAIFSGNKWKIIELINEDFNIKNMD